MRLSKRTVCLLLVTVLWPAVSVRSAKVASLAGHWILVSQGKSAYSILVPVSAAAPEKFAAEELQRYLFEITSVRLPITSRRSKHAIQIGLDPNVGRYGQLKSLNEDAFVIQGDSQKFYLAGNTPRGTLYAVYYFLEKYLDCGWISPGEDVIPRRSEVILPPYFHETQEPQFRMRSIWMYPFIGDRNLRTVDWASKNRLNWVAAGINSSNLWEEFNSREVLVPEIEKRGLKLQWGGHTFNTWVSPKKYFGSHPEYFSLINGKRDPKQLCVSNRDVAGVAAENVNAFLDANPEVDMVDVMLNDAAQWCECSACERMEEEKRLSAFSVGEKKTYYTHTNANIKFVNRIAQQVAKRHPDVLIESLAYLMLLDAPTRVRPEKNVMVGFADIQRRINYWYPIYFPNDELNRVHLDEMEKWLDLVGPDRFYAYKYYSRTSTARGMINMDTKAENLESKLVDLNRRTFYVYSAAIPKDLWYYRLMGIRNVQTEEWDWEEVNMYVYARSLWDLSVSSDSLLEAYCQRAYGDAAAPMIRHWLVLQEARDQYRSQKSLAMSFLQKARGMTENPKILQRIKRLEEIWSHL